MVADNRIRLQQALQAQERSFERPRSRIAAWQLVLLILCAAGDCGLSGAWMPR